MVPPPGIEPRTYRLQISDHVHLAIVLFFQSNPLHIVLRYLLNLLISVLTMAMVSPCLVGLVQAAYK